MLAAGVVAVGLMLGGRGEAPREAKFQGALLAEATRGQLSPINEAARRRLELERPTFAAPAIVLLVAVGVGLAGGALVLTGTVAGAGGLVFTIVGIAVLVSAVVMLAIGVFVLIGAIVARWDFDQRLKYLERTMPREPPPQPENPPPPSVRREPQGALIASF